MPNSVGSTWELLLAIEGALTAQIDAKRLIENGHLQTEYGTLADGSGSYLEIPKVVTLALVVDGDRLVDPLDCPAIYIDGRLAQTDPIGPTSAAGETNNQVALWLYVTDETVGTNQVVFAADQTWQQDGAHPLQDWGPTTVISAGSYTRAELVAALEVGLLAASAGAGPEVWSVIDLAGVISVTRTGFLGDDTGIPGSSWSISEALATALGFTKAAVGGFVSYSTADGEVTTGGAYGKDVSFLPAGAVTMSEVKRGITEKELAILAHAFAQAVTSALREVGGTSLWAYGAGVTQPILAQQIVRGYDFDGEIGYTAAQIQQTWAIEQIVRY